MYFASVIEILSSIFTWSLSYSVVTSSRLAASGTTHEYMTVCKVGTVGKISDYQPGDPGFNPLPQVKG